MIVDKDTGKVYDIRNDAHVDRLIDHATTVNLATDQKPSD